MNSPQGFSDSLSNCSPRREVVWVDRLDQMGSDGAFGEIWELSDYLVPFRPQEFMMSPLVAQYTVYGVGLIQAAIAAVELLLWRSPKVHNRLGFTLPEAQKVAPIVANAGLYNAFLAAGIFWSARTGLAEHQVEIFFLVCVIIAGLFAAATLKWTTLVLQTLPASVALWVVWNLKQ